jgi:HD superfamily phosphodiesterase
MDIKALSQHVEKYYLENNPVENVYHNILHVKEVVEMTQVIAKASNVSGNDLDLVTSAAWLHDIGHIKTWENHEELSANYAKKYMSSSNCSTEEIDIVVGCILATAIPHNPKNLLEEIICDADVSHLGLDNFFEKSELLKQEFENRKNKTFSDFRWIKKNIDFISTTTFYTKYGKNVLEKQRQINHNKLLQKYNLL